MYNYTFQQYQHLKDGFIDVPVILVGNKIDQFNDRMVSTEDGQKRSKEIACACFHEISVRESIDQVCVLFLNKFPSRNYKICLSPRLLQYFVTRIVFGVSYINIQSLNVPVVMCMISIMKLN